MKHVHGLAKGLGWFSIALGLTELLESKGVARYLGTTEREGTIQLFGLREIGAGMGILLSEKPDAAWLWTRVAGDALDLAALGAALNDRGTRHGNILTSILTVAGVTALDVYCAQQLSNEQ